MLSKLENFRLGENLPEGYVASTTLWLIDNEEIVGVTNLRHGLNEALRHCGGHIGLGIRPSMRGKGYGKDLMKLSVDQLRAMGERQIHIHCYADNLASANTTKAIGGELDSQVMIDDKLVERYIV
nr:GNAT family N-acetyltransferase [Shewanella sp. WXL01]